MKNTPKYLQGFQKGGAVAFSAIQANPLPNPLTDPLPEIAVPEMGDSGDTKPNFKLSDMVML
jgi:hypothetical protein